MSAVLAPAVRTTPWRQALPALGLVLAALLLLYRDTFAAMVGIWSRSDTFAHAYLVPPIVLWLVWRRRHALAPFTPRPQAWVLLPMAAAAAVWLLGDLAGINALTQLCATALLVLAVPAVLGTCVARQLLFPLAFLFFMVPVGEFLLPLMMEATANFTVAAVSMSGVPVYREGLQFVIPSGSWSVVEACSGVRYLIASFMVGTLFAYLNYSSPRRRLLFAAISILVPVLANWLRAYMIVMLGHLSGNKLAVGVDHIIYGWLFFGVVILLMFLVGARWSQPESAAVPPPARRLDQAESKPAATWAVAWLAVALLAASQAAAWQLRHAAPAPAPVLALPDLQRLAAAPDQTPLLQPVFPGAAAQASRVYGSGPDAVTVHVAYYRRQGYGAKLASSDNTLVRSNDHRWNVLATGRASASVGGRSVALRTADIVDGGLGNTSTRQRLDVRQLYWACGRLTIDDHWATALSVLCRLAGQGDDGAVITIYTAGDTEAATGPRLQAFINRHFPALQAQLAAVRAAR